MLLIQLLAKNNMAVVMHGTSREPKLCIDCAHAVERVTCGWVTARLKQFLGVAPPTQLMCGHPNAVDRVTGRPESTCEKQRSFSVDCCSPAGQWFMKSNISRSRTHFSVIPINTGTGDPF